MANGKSSLSWKGGDNSMLWIALPGRIAELRINGQMVDRIRSHGVGRGHGCFHESLLFGDRSETFFAAQHEAERRAFNAGHYWKTLPFVKGPVNG